MKELGTSKPGSQQDALKNSSFSDKKNGNLSDASENDLSLFPIDGELARSTLQQIQNRIETSDKGTVTENSLKKIREENKPLFSEAVKNSLDEKELDLKNTVYDYLLGVVTSYEILEQQANARGREMPKVSKETIDAFAKDTEEMTPSEEAFWDEVDKTSDKDSGFMLPIQEAALDIQDPLAQEGFLIGALDVYHQVKKAELAKKMDQELHFDANEELS